MDPRPARAESVPHRIEALEALLVERGLVDAAAVDGIIAYYEDSVALNDAGVVAGVDGSAAELDERAGALASRPHGHDHG